MERCSKKKQNKVVILIEVVDIWCRLGGETSVKHGRELGKHVSEIPV